MFLNGQVLPALGAMLENQTLDRFLLDDVIGREVFARLMFIRIPGLVSLLMVQLPHVTREADRRHLGTAALKTAPS